jgi:hypothetical protein
MLVIVLSVASDEPPGLVRAGGIVVDVVMARPAYTEEEVDVVYEGAVPTLPVVYLLAGTTTPWGAGLARAS